MFKKINMKVTILFFFCFKLMGMVNRKDSKVSCRFKSSKSSWATSHKQHLRCSYCKSLVSSSQTQDQVKGWLLLDVVIRQSTTILELFARKDQPLLVRGNPFLVLDLGLDIIDCVWRFNLQGDCFPGEGLDEDLHTTSKTKHKMEGGFFLNVVIRKCSAILQLFAGEDQPLLVWGNSFLVLDLCFYVVNGVGGFYFEGDGFPCQCFDKYLHTTSQTQDQVKRWFFLDVIIRQGAAILQLFASEDQSLLVWGNSYKRMNKTF